MDSRSSNSVSPQSKGSTNLTSPERARPVKHNEGDSSKHHLDDLGLARDDITRRHSFK